MVQHSGRELVVDPEEEIVKLANSVVEKTSAAVADEEEEQHAKEAEEASCQEEHNSSDVLVDPGTVVGTASADSAVAR